MWPFRTGLFHLMSHDLSMSHILVLHCFLWTSISLYDDYAALVYPLASWGTFGFFQFGAIMNNAAMNILVQLFVWTWVFNSLGYTRCSEIAGSYGKFCLIYKKIQNHFPKHFTISHQQPVSPNFSIFSSTIVIM